MTPKDIPEKLHNIAVDLKAVKAVFEQALDEENKQYDALPADLQSEDEGMEIEEFIEAIENAVDELDEALESLEDGAERIDDALREQAFLNRI